MVASSGSRLSQLVAASNALKAAAPPNTGMSAMGSAGYGGAVSSSYASYGMSGNCHSPSHNLSIHTINICDKSTIAVNNHCQRILSTLINHM